MIGSNQVAEVLAEIAMETITCALLGTLVKQCEQAGVCELPEPKL